MADSGLRQTLIMLRLPVYPNSVSTGELRQHLIDAGYEVTLRTVQRDIQALITILPIIDGPEGGWAYSQNSKAHIPFMCPLTALAFVMAAQHLDSLMPPHLLDRVSAYVNKAKDTLANSPKYKAWPNKVKIYPQSTVLQQAHADDTIAQIIYQALFEGRVFTASYNQSDIRIVHPLGLVYRGDQIFLIVHFDDVNDIRITSVQRYDEAMLSDNSVKVPTGFSLQQYIDEGHLGWFVDGPKTINFKGEFKHWWGLKLSESPLSDDQVIKDINEQKVMVSATVDDTYELRRWLLSLAGQVRVIEPLALKEWLVEQWQAALDIECQERPFIAEQHGYYDIRD